MAHQPHQAVTIFHNKDVVGYTGSASSIINVNGVFNLSSYDLTADDLMTWIYQRSEVRWKSSTAPSTWLIISMK